MAEQTVEQIVTQLIADTIIRSGGNPSSIQAEKIADLVQKRIDLIQKTREMLPDEKAFQNLREHIMSFVIAYDRLTVPALATALMLFVVRLIEADVGTERGFAFAHTILENLNVIDSIVKQSDESAPAASLVNS